MPDVLTIRETVVRAKAEGMLAQMEMGSWAIDQCYVDEKIFGGINKIMKKFIKVNLIILVIFCLLTIQLFSCITFSSVSF